MGRKRKNIKRKGFKSKGKRVEYRMPRKTKRIIISEEEQAEILNKRFIGTYEKSQNFGFVVPDFKKLPTDIYISKNNTKKAKNGQKVLVEVTKLPGKGSKSIEGVIIDVIGNADARDIEMKCLISEFDIPAKFPIGAQKEAEEMNQLIDKKDIPNREDFRDLDIFTIDGDDSKDLDDAISVSKDEKGIYTLGVYIADVSYYVKEGMEIDKEAINRGTSIYMLDRVVPMLPVELSNGICSLNAGQDRFVLAITMKIDQKGVVKSSKISKGIINVRERMTYTNVQKIIENSDKAVTKRYK